MQQKQPEVVATFDKCPVCKLREEPAKILGKPELALGTGTDFFVDQLANEVKEKGWMRVELNFYADIVPPGVPFGIVRDQMPSMEAKIPIGSAVPGFRIFLDVCLDCGCYFARKLIRAEAVKGLQSPAPGEIPVDKKGRPMFFGKG